MLEKLFKLKQNNTTAKREIVAGIITFLTMSYILAVNPNILGSTGMDRGALFTATALAAVVGTLLYGFITNLPIAAAPGMGLNAFFAFTVVHGMGYSWQFALTAVFIEGLIFILLTLTNVRELILNSIPLNIKKAIAVGIGLFIAFIGLTGSGIIVSNPSTMISLGNMGNPTVWVTLLGLFLTIVLMHYKINGAILIGIIVATIFGLFFGVSQMPQGSWINVPPSIAPVFAKFEWQHIFTFDMLIVVFTFLFVNLFDTLGTLIGVVTKIGLVDKTGNFPQAKKALFADALGTTFGAVLGTSTVTAYIESSAGVANGGKTGLTSVSTAIMFIIALFFAPLFGIVPAAATAPALIIVGYMMISEIVNIDFKDITEAIPAFLTIIMMPFAYSIAEGIIFGMISYAIIKLFTGKFKDMTPAFVVIVFIMLLKTVLDVVL